MNYTLTCKPSVKHAKRGKRKCACLSACRTEVLSFSLHAHFTAPRLRISLRVHNSQYPAVICNDHASRYCSVCTGQLCLSTTETSCFIRLLVPKEDAVLISSQNALHSLSCFES